MRRQRYFYTLPSQDDSFIIPDSDNTSFISSHYSYPETLWSPIMSTEPENLVPFCIYQYPFLQVGPNQFQASDQFPPSIASASMNNLDSVSHYPDGFSEICDIVSGPTPSSALYGDGYFPEEIIYDDSFCYETIKNITPEIPNAFPVVSNYGTATILLRHLVRIDVSPEKAVYVTNPPGSCVASISGIGDKSCIVHPNGRIYHDGIEIHMSTLNRRAKISKRGIIFTSADHCLSYIVDASGTKTTAEKFQDLSHDFSLDIFYDNAMACNNVEECYKMVHETTYKSYWNGDEVWFIGGFRIKQDQRGDVKVTRCNGRQVIRTSPTTGQISVKTFSAEFTVNRYTNNYFNVRKGNMQVTASLRGFNVQNGTQKAGFNSCGRIVLF